MRSTKLPSWIESALGFGPVPSPPHVFYVGPDELRYAAFAAGPQGWAFDTERHVPLPHGLYQTGVLGGPIREPEIFAGALRQLIADLEPMKQASLVVPDSWLRLTFTEMAELPGRAVQRQEVLAWKLRRLVPFRVEDLRISATRVTPFPNQDEPLRLLLGFAVENLMAQLEAHFEAAGIHVGCITNNTLALASALEHTVAPEDLAAVVSVTEESYTLAFFRAGEPLLYRYKSFSEEAGRADSVARDLRMTSSFLHEHFPGAPFARVFVAAPEDLEHQWLGWVASELEVTPEPVNAEHLELTRLRPGTSWCHSAPLLGAAMLEVD
ncbi:MAG: hypothetical protein MPN21_10320 [Thermoanaerobaculia bacterium]|nr:hypothetical protein [Thermoanaerobaculia bacterium]